MLLLKNPYPWGKEVVELCLEEMNSEGKIFTIDKYNELLRKL